jgi:short-subunit dehydrogenase
MTVKLKPLSEQVLVITGASSGIGLTTARMAAERGVKGLVLAARSDDALHQLEQRINTAGKTQAVAVACDVADESAIRRVAEVARERFGGFDAWINNAGVSVYGRLTEVSQDDHRRLFETNFWGVVHGSRIAVEHLRERGGSLINIGSTLSERAIPLQGMYVASKHAVKGFTDALRMEVEEAKWPISVTLIKPAAIDTPYTQHAKSYLEDAPKNPPPVYAPDLVAETILYAVEHPVRDMFVGSAGKAFSVAEKIAPRLTDLMMEKTMFQQQHSGKPRRDRDALHDASHDLRERGGHDGMVREHSLYTSAMTHPKASLATLIGVGVAAAVAVVVLGSRPKPRMRVERAWDYARRAPKRVADQMSSWW